MHWINFKPACSLFLANNAFSLPQVFASDISLITKLSTQINEIKIFRRNFRNGKDLLSVDWNAFRKIVRFDDIDFEISPYLDRILKLRQTWFFQIAYRQWSDLTTNLLQRNRYELSIHLCRLTNITRRNALLSKKWNAKNT